MQHNLVSYRGIVPKVSKNVFLGNGAYLIGDVTVGGNSSIWFNTVVRGDVHPIKIGQYTNIQDNCTIHVMKDRGAVIGDYVTVGHGAILHACTIGNNCLIGMGAIVLSYVEIGENSIIGAGAMITEHKKIPPNSLVIGSPARVIRTVTPAEIEAIKASALKYYDEALQFI